MNARRISLGVLVPAALATALFYGTRSLRRTPPAGPDVDDIDRAVYAEVIAFAPSGKPLPVRLLQQTTKFGRPDQFYEVVTNPRGFVPVSLQGEPERKDPVPLPEKMVRSLVDRNRRSAVITAVPTDVPIAYLSSEKPDESKLISQAFYKDHPEGVQDLQFSLPGYNTDRTSAVVLVTHTGQSSADFWAGLLWLDKTQGRWETKRAMGLFAGN